MTIYLWHNFLCSVGAGHGGSTDVGRGSSSYWVSWFFLDQFIHQSHVQVAQIEDEMVETDEEQAEFETFER